MAYFKGSAHIFVTLVVAMMGWFANMPIVALVFLACVVLVEVAVQKTAESAVQAVFFGTFLFSDALELLKIEYIALVVCVIVVICVAVVVQKWATSQRIKWNSVASGLACMVVATVFGGGIANIGSTFWLAGVGATAGTLGGYLLLQGVAKRDKVAKTGAAVAVLLIVQSLVVLTENGEFLDNILYKILNVGWGVGNNVALVLMMSAPLVLYAATKSRFAWVYVAIFCALIAVVMFSFSRGCILILMVSTPPMLVYAVMKASHKKQIVWVLAIFAAIVAVFLWLNREQLLSLWGSVADKGLTDNGRFDLWRLAIEDFANGSIMFGRGLLFGSDISVEPPTFNWYHSSVLQMISNFGVLGGVAFAYCLATRYRRLCTKGSYCICAFMAIFMAECYGLIDVTYFTPYYLLPLIVVLSAV
ncbi:MAG: hypothetical protein R3Y23_01295 [Bacillota bacterium]